MNLSNYLESVLEVIENFDQHSMRVRLIVCLDWKHSEDESWTVVRLAHQSIHRGVVGIDICGNPKLSHEFKKLIPAITWARHHGLKLTLHFAEVSQSSICFDQFKNKETHFHHFHLTSVLMFFLYSFFFGGGGL